MKLNTDSILLTAHLQKNGVVNRKLVGENIHIGVQKER